MGLTGRARRAAGVGSPVPASAPALALGSMKSQARVPSASTHALTTPSADSVTTSADSRHRGKPGRESSEVDAEAQKPVLTLSPVLREPQGGSTQEASTEGDSVTTSACSCHRGSRGGRAQRWTQNPEIVRPQDSETSRDSERHCKAFAACTSSGTLFWTQEQGSPRSPIYPPIPSPSTPPHFLTNHHHPTHALSRLLLKFHSHAPLNSPCPLTLPHELQVQGTRLLAEHAPPGCKGRPTEPRTRRHA